MRSFRQALPCVERYNSLHAINGGSGALGRIGMALENRHALEDGLVWLRYLEYMMFAASAQEAEQGSLW